MTNSSQSDYGQEGREVKGKLPLVSVLKYRSPQHESYICALSLNVNACLHRA